MCDRRQEPLLHLLTWLSPAFPTGGYAHSHGLEWVVEAGDVCNEGAALDWLRDLLTLGSGRTDAILLRHAYRDQDVTALAKAAQPSAERQAETLGQGGAFTIAGQVWDGILPQPVPYPIALAKLARQHDVPEDAATLGLLHAMAANWVSAAVRLVPLGQTAGLRILRALEPTLLSLMANTRTAGLDEIGGACFRSDIASMRHETQHTRLFRS